MTVIKRTDANQQTIIDGFRKLGYSVADISKNGNGCPDLLVSKNLKNFKRTFLVEVKNPKGRNRIEKSQNHFKLTWQGDIFVIRTTDEILKLDRELKLATP